MSALKAADLGSITPFAMDHCLGRHTSNFKTGTLVATLPDAWPYRVSAGTGWPNVSILWVR